MKKTYVTTLPDHIGAFLKASRCFAALGMNITRTSYNKAIDSNMLFVDAEGTAEQHERAFTELSKIGYLQAPQEKSVVLLEFRLEDKPGSVERILELINEYRFNISYMSSQENATGYQMFKMGLFVEDTAAIESFLEAAEKLCSVRVIDYNHSERVYDNSIFYNSFVSELVRNMNLSEESRHSLLIDANLAMQVLDESGLSPYRTFDNISRFAGLLAKSRGEHYDPRITRHRLTAQTELLMIEPPCGSNTMALIHEGEYLFIDTGYACYGEEQRSLLCSLIPGFESMKKRVLVTHADVDHCGLLNLFDEVLVNERSAECLLLEHAGENGFRESNPIHKPYIGICKTLTSYKPVEPSKLQVLWNSPAILGAPLVQIGFLSFGDMNFEVYEGKGGHLKGEILLIDYDNHVAFTGDVYVNLKAMTPDQAEYNRCAPILMTSVDTDPAMCALEREALFARLGAGKWRVFGAHGAGLDYDVSASK